MSIRPLDIDRVHRANKAMTWYRIRTASGHYLNSGDRDWCYFFPTRAAAALWAVPGDTIEEAPAPAMDSQSGHFPPPPSRA